MKVKIKNEKGTWYMTEDFGSFFYAQKVRGMVLDEQQRIFDKSEIVRKVGA